MSYWPVTTDEDIIASLSESSESVETVNCVPKAVDTMSKFEPLSVKLTCKVAASALISATKSSTISFKVAFPVPLV